MYSSILPESAPCALPYERVIARLSLFTIALASIFSVESFVNSRVECSSKSRYVAEGCPQDDILKWYSFARILVFLYVISISALMVGVGLYESNFRSRVLSRIGRILKDADVADHNQFFKIKNVYESPEFMDWVKYDKPLSRVQCSFLFHYSVHIAFGICFALLAHRIDDSESSFECVDAEDKEEKCRFIGQHFVLISLICMSASSFLTALTSSSGWNYVFTIDNPSEGKTKCSNILYKFIVFLRIFLLIPTAFFMWVSRKCKQARGSTENQPSEEYGEDDGSDQNERDKCKKWVTFAVNHYPGFIREDRLLELFSEATEDIDYNIHISAVKEFANNREKSNEEGNALKHVCNIAEEAGKFIYKLKGNDISKNPYSSFNFGTVRAIIIQAFLVNKSCADSFLEQCRTQLGTISTCKPYTIIVINDSPLQKFFSVAKRKYKEENESLIDRGTVLDEILKSLHQAQRQSLHPYIESFGIVAVLFNYSHVLSHATPLARAVGVGFEDVAYSGEEEEKRDSV